ncbi:MAG: hypothetical protein ACKVOE_00975 [Rickettsiales bacterium]
MKRPLFIWFIAALAIIVFVILVAPKPDKDLGEAANLTAAMEKVSTFVDDAIAEERAANFRVQWDLNGKPQILRAGYLGRFDTPEEAKKASAVESAVTRALGNADMVFIATVGRKGGDSKDILILGVRGGPDMFYGLPAQQQGPIA